MTWNRPRRPRDNAVVERSQGVSQRWTEPPTCADAPELQERLDRLDAVQRERYPHVGRQSRAEAFPALAHSGRAYTPTWEAAHWSLQRVLDELSEYAVVRRVDRSGKVWLYDQSHWVGKAAVGREIYVTLDPEQRDGVFQDAKGPGSVSSRRGN